MSQENVEIVRRGYEAFNRGDLDASVADAAADIEYISGGGVPGFTGAYTGVEEYKLFVGWMLEEFDDVRVEVNELIDADDQVLASVTSWGRGKQSGVEVSWDFWQLWTLRDGEIVRGQGFTNREQALKAAGLRE